MPIDTSRPCDSRANGETTDEFRASLLQTYARFGPRMAEMASRSLQGATLTRRDAKRLLQAAARLAEARKSAFVSAGLKLTGSAWLQSDRPSVPQPRHAALLECCVAIVSEDTGHSIDARSLEKAARQLHDRVRAFLEKRGQWPILNAIELEARAKPAAQVLAAWGAEASGRHREPSRM